MDKTIISSKFKKNHPSLDWWALRKAFHELDHDADGFLTVDELSRICQNLGINIDQSIIQFLVEPHIQPRNIGLAFRDFMALQASLHEPFFGLDDMEEMEKQERGCLKRTKREETRSKHELESVFRHSMRIEMNVNYQPRNFKFCKGSWRSRRNGMKSAESKLREFRIGLIKWDRGSNYYCAEFS